MREFLASIYDDLDHSTNYTDLEYIEILKETNLAKYVRFDIDGDIYDVWLPISECFFSGDYGESDLLVVIPEWLADKNNLK